MFEREVKLNLIQLKPYDSFFAMELLRGEKINELSQKKLDLNSFEVSLTFSYGADDFTYINKLLTQLIKFMGLSMSVDELLTWGYLTKFNLEDAISVFSRGVNRKEHLSSLKEMLDFKELVQNSHELEVRLINKSIKTGARSYSSVTIPKKSHPSSIYYSNTTALKVLELAIKIATDEAVGLGDWIEESHICVENIANLLNTLPKLEENPSSNFTIAYAIEPILKYLRGEGYSNYEGEYFSHEEALFIRNFLTIFKYIPGAKQIKNQELYTTTDINYNNNLRYALDQVRMLPDSIFYRLRK